MEMSSEFVQIFVNKLQTEAAEGTKQRLFLLAQNEYLSNQLQEVKAELESLKEKIAAEKDVVKMDTEKSVDDKQKVINLSEKG